MTDYGELLYQGKTDTTKGGIVFLLLGILLVIGANFIYAKTMLMIIGGLFALVGLYMLLFKRSETISIYDDAIVLTEKGKEYPILREQISHIEYQKLKVRRSPVVNYYPILVLNDQRKVFINKAFNTVINQDFKKVIEAYID